MGRDASTGEAEQPAGRADVVEQRMQLAGGDGRRCWGEGAELVAAPHIYVYLIRISEEPQRGGRLRERVSAVREQLPGTRLNLGCRLNLHNYSLHGLQPGVLMSGHLGV